MSLLTVASPRPNVWVVFHPLLGVYRRIATEKWLVQLTKNQAQRAINNPQDWFDPKDLDRLITKALAVDIDLETQL